MKKPTDHPNKLKGQVMFSLRSFFSNEEIESEKWRKAFFLAIGIGGFLMVLASYYALKALGMTPWIETIFTSII